MTAMLKGNYASLHSPTNQNIFTIIFTKCWPQLSLFATNYPNHPSESSPLECHHWRGFQKERQLFFFFFLFFSESNKSN